MRALLQNERVFSFSSSSPLCVHLIFWFGAKVIVNSVLFIEAEESIARIEAICQIRFAMIVARAREGRQNVYRSEFEIVIVHIHTMRLGLPHTISVAYVHRICGFSVGKCICVSYTFDLCKWGQCWII